MTRIYVDANILLHAKPLQDISWETYEQPPITIIITSTNLRELDDHKDQHPKKHIRERARKALQRIEQGLDNPTLRPGVTLEIEDSPPRINYDAHHLDPTQPDDQLLASTIASNAEHTEPTILYTHDVGPRIKAKKRGVTTRTLPDTDKLPPIKDETEAENERLKRELHEITTAAPDLALTVDSTTASVTTTTLGSAPEPLDESALRQAANDAHAALPAFDLTSIPQDPPPPIRRNKDGKRVLVIDTTSTPPDLSAIAHHEYARYENDRANYRTAYDNYLRRTHEAQAHIARTIKLDLGITNNGGKPAEQIHVEITLPQQWELHVGAPGLPRPPAPPRMPRTRHEELAERLLNLPSLAEYARHDLFPHNFNPWHTGPEIEGNTITWRRQSLNHGFTKPLSTIYLTAAGNLTPVRITYEIHAANAVKPFTGSILIRPQPHQSATEEAPHEQPNP